ncbi:hypothetical protein ACWGQ2_18015 [Arthrobacter sp. NPDC055585]
MTVAAAEAMGSVAVRFTTAGIPLAVRHEGRVWAVAANPVHWFTRCSWWDQGDSAARGSGDLVSVEYWQVQVRLTASSDLRTFTLRRDPRSDEWVLESIMESVA